MKIYKVLKTIRAEGLILDSDKDVNKYWCVKPPEDAKIVPIGGNEQYDTLYAVEYDIDNDFTTRELLDIMFNELPVSDCMEICKGEDDVKELYMNYLKNPLNDKEFKQKLKEAADSADSASGLAGAAFLISLFK